MPTMFHLIDSLSWSTASKMAELLKVRIVCLVLVVVCCSYVISANRVDFWVLFLVSIGTMLVAASGSVFNQVLEQYTDKSMKRTSLRPLANGSFLAGNVSVVGVVFGGIGLVVLFYGVGVLAGIFGVFTWFLYVFVYTPMKFMTIANTAIGALSGSMPVLIGWAASESALDFRLASVFSVTYLWQLPHFMAIGWIYRFCYARAGSRMIPAVDVSGFRAGLQAVVAAWVLIPISVVPWLLHGGFRGFLIPVFVLGVLQWWCCVRFLVTRDENSARQLFRASLVYLPGFLAFVSIG